MKKGILARAPEWRKHLRRYAHRLFWKRERQAGGKAIKQEIAERASPTQHGIRAMARRHWNIGDPQ